MGVPFSNAAENLKQLRSSPASWACAAIVIGIQSLIAAVGGANQQPARSWFESLALQPDGFFSGKIWQIVSYGFLHGAWWHAGLNAAFLILIGSRIEHMVGGLNMVKTVAMGILAGGATHLLFGPVGADAPLLVGASGGAVALLLLLTTLSPQSRMMPLPVTGRSLGIGILAVELLLAVMDPESRVPVFSDFGKQMSDHGLGSSFGLGHACHFGGGMAGLLMGKWLLRPRITLQRLRRNRARREASESRRVG